MGNGNVRGQHFKPAANAASSTSSKPPENNHSTAEASTPRDKPEAKAAPPTPKERVNPEAKKVKVGQGDTLTKIAKQKILESLSTARAKDPDQEKDRLALKAAFSDKTLTDPEAQIIAHEVRGLHEDNKLPSDQIQVGQELVVPAKDSPELAKMLTNYAKELELTSGVYSGKVKSGDTVSSLVGKGLEQIQPNLSKLPTAAQKEIQDGYTKAFLAKNGIEDPDRISEGQVFAQPEVSPELAKKMVQAEAAHALRTGTETKEAFAKLTPGQQDVAAGLHAESAIAKFGRSAEDVVNKRLLGGWQANHIFAGDRLPADKTKAPDVSSYIQGPPAEAVATLGVPTSHAKEWMGLVLTGSNPSANMLATKKHDLAEARKAVDGWVAALDVATPEQKETIAGGRIPVELKSAYTAARDALETTIQYEPSWSLATRLPIKSTPQYEAPIAHSDSDLKMPA